MDHFVFSELFQLKAGTSREDKLTPFWKEVDTLLHRVVHLQQAVLPHSNIHHAETVVRSEEHTSELQSLMRISYAVFCLKKKIKHKNIPKIKIHTQNVKNTQKKYMNKCAYTVQ